MHGLSCVCWKDETEHTDISPEGKERTARHLRTQDPGLTLSSGVVLSSSGRRDGTFESVLFLVVDDTAAVAMEQGSTYWCT